MNRLLTILTSFIAAAALVAGTACSRDQKANAATPEAVRGVTLLNVQQARIPDYVEAVGTIRAQETAQLSAEIVGTIRAVNVVEGQRVRKGDVLVVLDDAQLRAGLDRAQASVVAAQQDMAAADADYGLAQATLNRYQFMYERKSVSPHELDEVQARYKAAAAHRDAARAGQSQATAAQAQAQVMLGYTRIRAPFDGVITAKNATAGALAAPGTPLITVEDTRRFRLEATVDESDLRFVKLSGSAPVAIDALGDERTGKVVQIVPAADPASRSFVVKVELPNDSRLRSGLFGRVRFPRGERDAIMVPRASILDRGQMQGVYVVDSTGVVGLRYVTLGKASGDKVEVLSGLTDGERLVAAHGGRELAGKKVEN